jgi:GTP cyclohydrolase I
MIKTCQHKLVSSYGSVLVVYVDKKKTITLFKGAKNDN